MKFELLLNYTANLTGAVELGATPYGNRTIFEVGGGVVTGDRISGTIREPSAADWMYLTEDFGHLDVRATIETNDGAGIYLEYLGKLEFTDAVKAALGGEEITTNFGDQYFFTNPRLQTGDERYKWVNNLFCVGQGRLLPGQVEYNVYQVVH